MIKQDRVCAGFGKLHSVSEEIITLYEDIFGHSRELVN